MESPLQILQIEDNRHDAELVRRMLAAAKIDHEAVRVETQEELVAALARQPYDLVLADYNLPTFDGASALRIVRELAPETPFVFVSGTIGEERAIESLKSGAADYVLKDHLARLAPSVQRALREAEERRGRRQAEALLREQALLLDKARDAIIVRDLDGKLIYWNKGAETLYGWSPEEAVGKNVRELIYRGKPAAMDEARAQLLARGEWSGELHHLNRAGKEIVVDSRWTLLRDGDGLPRSILSINSDVTEKKKLEAQFLRAQRLESIGTLAGGIAHDLNNMLGPILMAVELLRARCDDPQSERLLSMMETNVQRGSDLVKQVLSFARGSEGERVPLQIRYVLSDIEKLLADTFPRQIQMRTSLPRDLWAIQADSTQLHQVLMNLCVNARDAMPRGGTLTIQAENVIVDEHFAHLHVGARPGPYLVVSVTDTGEGIPAEALDKIFEPFFTTKELGKGTGLGLSTVMGIVQSHGGFITVYSEPGRGTRFQVYLPALESAETQEAVREQSLLPGGQGQLILLVDDEATIREITKLTLETYGYRVVTALDGTEAVALYAQRLSEVAAVIIDMMMPVMDGPATIRALRKLAPDVRIIAVSGLVGNERIAEAAGQDADIAFLAKPFTTEKLLTTLHELVTTPAVAVPG